jgi:hypothetical protein
MASPLPAGAKKSSDETVRSPWAPSTVKVAPSAANSGGRWLVGSLTQTLPPTVPRFCTWRSAIVAATSARMGLAAATSGEPTSSL